MANDLQPDSASKRRAKQARPRIRRLDELRRQEWRRDRHLLGAVLLRAARHEYTHHCRTGNARFPTKRSPLRRCDRGRSSRTKSWKSLNGVAKRIWDRSIRRSSLRRRDPRGRWSQEEKTRTAIQIASNQNRMPAAPAAIHHPSLMLPSRRSSSISSRDAPTSPFAGTRSPARSSPRAGRRSQRDGGGW